MVKFIFWSSLFLIFYVYLGYPLLAAILGAIINRRVNKKPFTPSVTVVIAAFNEQAVIEATVRNKLSQKYPEDCLKVLVVSDDSTDKTDDIVRSIGDSRVRLLRQEPRAGKTSALNIALSTINSEIVVFADANSIYAPDAVRQLVQNFADPEVGYVSGKMIYANPDGTPIGEGCSTYMKYENLLRTFETRLGSIVGVDGGVDAIRKSLYQPMAADQLPDFVLPLKVVTQKYRVVYEHEAILWEPSLKGAKEEYQMRVRVALRALWALNDMRHLMFNSGNILFTWQLWSHKTLRYICFIFFITAFWTNFLLIKEGVFYTSIFLIQCFAYSTLFLSKIHKSNTIFYRLINFVRYFVLINAACAHAFIKFVFRKKMVIWTPRKG